MRSNVLPLKIDTTDVATITCKINGCDSSRQYRGMCVPHLKEDPDAPRCSHQGCKEPRLSGKNALCGSHRSQFVKNGTTWDIEPCANTKPCQGPDCSRKAVNRDGYCRPHHEQWINHQEVWPLGTRKGTWGRKAILHCIEPDCGDQVHVWGRCEQHAIESFGACWIRGCPNPGSHKLSGLCDPHRRRERSMAHFYGFGFQHRMKMAEEQDHKCLICGKDDDPLDDPLHIDHDHHTGKVRGLLCGSCNRGIGLFRHDVNHLQEAIRYLEVTK